MVFAKENGFVFNAQLSKKNLGRAIYSDKDGINYSLDLQHGRFEVLNSKGKYLGEIDFNGKANIEFMNKMILNRGTKIEFEAKADAISVSKVKYMLTECHEPDFVFQLVCIDGYYSGIVSGLIKSDNSLENIQGVTKTHLINELKRNFLGFRIKSLKIVLNTSKKGLVRIKI